MTEKVRTLYRSALTGRFVSARYARRYPERTLRERLHPAREPYLKPNYPDPTTVH